MSSSEFSYYGKLPGNGDFLSKNLSSEFVRSWDGWLQRVISNSRNEMSDNWLNYYLTSPIWHFVLSPGTCDDSSWAGVMIPSVDKVGRYYPFTLFKKIPVTINPIEFLEKNEHWFEEKQNILLALLDERLTIENIDEVIKLTSSPIINQSHIKNSLTIENSYFSIEKGLSESLPNIMNTLINYTYPVYSIWCTKGSNNINPSLLVCNELPSLNQYNALLDGQWKRWGWNYGALQ